MKYSETHPLWPVWDLQRQILKRGGKINRRSDLLAYFEGRSLEPESNASDIFMNLANANERWNNSNYDKTKDLIKIEYLTYNQSTEGLHLNTSSVKRIKSNDKIPPGFGNGIPERLKNSKVEKGYLINDNEYVIRKNELSQIVIVNSKYVDVIRLVINGYKPFKQKPAKNKNLLPLIILSMGLIIAMLIYAYANRYEVNYPFRIDKWTGTMVTIKLKK